MSHEQQALLQAGEEEKEFVKSQTHSEFQLSIVSSHRSLHDGEVQQEGATQNSQYRGAQLRVQLQTETFMMTSVTEKVDSPIQTSRPADMNPWEHIPSTSN